MEGPKTWLGISVPAAWSEVVASAVLTSIVGFVSLLLKEWMETREWDVPACAVDGLSVGAGMLVVNVLLKLTR
jgi:hypothetical protein